MHTQKIFMSTTPGLVWDNNMGWAVSPVWDTKISALTSC